MLQPQGKKIQTRPLTQIQFCSPQNQDVITNVDVWLQKSLYCFLLHNYTIYRDGRLSKSYMDTHPIPKKIENQTAAEQLAELEAELEVHPCVGGWCSWDIATGDGRNPASWGW